MKPAKTSLIGQLIKIKMVFLLKIEIGNKTALKIMIIKFLKA